MTARMAGVELQLRREYLGFTPETLAAILDVNPRTVRSWESGRDPIPDRIGAELTAIEGMTDEAVEELVGQLRFGNLAALQISDIADDEDWQSRPGAGRLPPRWWRHVVARAYKQVPRRMK